MANPETSVFRQLLPRTRGGVRDAAAIRGVTPYALRKKLSRAYDRVLEELEFTD